MSFWNSWALWEKMVFVMGASIVTVVAIGGVKLGYNRWRLRKYTAIAATKEAQRKEMQHSESVARARAREVPFGIRAIESGIEVDGVWISRSNTPAHSTPGSPALSVSSQQNAALPGRPGSASTIPRLEMPQPAHHEPPGPARSSTQSRPLSSSFDRAVSAEIIPSRASSSEFTNRGRPTYQPRRSSHLRYSNSHELDNSEALAALEGRQLSITPEGSNSTWHGNISSSGSSSESSNGEGYGGGNQPSRSRNSHSRLDPADAYSRNTYVPNRRVLDTLPSQRRSQVAETSHFLPRGKQSSTSGDWTAAVTPAEQRYTFAEHPSPYQNTRDPFATPLLDEQSREPPSFQHFVHKGPPTNRFDMMNNSQMAQPQDNQFARQSINARQVNPGFEILRPSALDRPRQSSDIADWGQDLELGNKRQSRRLQRKRGESNATESRFTEEV